MGFKPEEALLKRLGIQATQPEEGCCGMAGAFGFESEHYALSQACAERALLPALRQDQGKTRLIADGFSCREQIWQATGRRPQHLAQVLAEAMMRPEVAEKTEGGTA
jgi:Fe-S oxidoreductase